MFCLLYILYRQGYEEPFGVPLRRTLQATVRRASMQQAVKGAESRATLSDVKFTWHCREYVTPIAIQDIKFSIIPLT